MANGKIKFLPVIVVLTLVTLACNSALPQTVPTQSVISTLEPPKPQQGQNNLPLTEADVPRVPVEDAKSALDNGDAVIVDVRSADAYAEGHITGAISIPLSDIENDIANVPLDKDQWIITYCT
jgi:phage shock protein E